MTAAQPRLVIAGVHSGVGKTTLCCALLAALRRRGLRVAPFKTGPDYIDPTYQTRAAGVPCRNLDTWMLAPATVQELFGRATRAADVALIEGVMGLYDGRASNDPSGGGEDEGSTAHLAKLLDAPVLLVVDAKGASRTVAAVVLGCQRFDPAVRLAGVLLTGISSPRHLEMVAGPITRATGLPVLGYLPRREEFALPSRHLGLIPAGEQGVDAAFFERLAAQAEETIDVDGVLMAARQAPSLPPPPRGAAPLFPGEPPTARRARIALALDDAFHFYYEDSLDLLRAHSADLLPFSPLRDAALPDGAQAVYLGGGFPEVFVDELAANRPMLDAIRTAAANGLPVYGECGGLMYLGQGILDDTGQRHHLTGLIPRWSQMGQRRVTLGYRLATARRGSFLVPPGGQVRGHEFHWSVLETPATAGETAYDLTAADGRNVGYDGFVAGPAGNVLASYLHLHFGADARLAPALLNACARAGQGAPAWGMPAWGAPG